MDTDRASETRAIITGVGLAALGLFCGLSLFSYSSADMLDYEAGTHSANLAGLVGARVAQHLFCFYGAGAWVLTFALLIFGVLMCAARALSGLFLRACGTILLLLLVCTWAGTCSVSGEGVAEKPILLARAYPAGSGGLLGSRYLAPPLVSYFGTVGVYLVLAMAGLLAGLLIAQEFTESVLAFLGVACVRLAQKGWSAASGRVRSAVGPLSPVFAPAGVPAGGTGRRPKGGETAQRGSFLVPPVSAGRPSSEGLIVEPPPKPRRATAVLAPGKPTAEEVEAEEAKQRRAEALRQAEAAEQERLQREKQLREQSQKAEREALALEKLEKERAARERERERAQAKFRATVTGKSPAAEPAAAEGAAPGLPVPPKPKLPDDYKLPNYECLEAKDLTQEVSSEVLKERGAKLIETLWEFKMGTKLVGIHHGPAVTMYELFLDPGIKVQRVISLSDNLAMAMKSEFGVRVIAPLPGKDTIGIEIPNSEDYVVRLRPILEAPLFRNQAASLPIVLGRDATGTPLVADLSKMPHLLIAGTTGSGKSVCVNAIILSIMALRRPHEVKLVLVDPKQVEMTDFKGIPHLLCPVVSDMRLAAGVLTWAVQKMEDRYERMSKVGVRNISTFNKLPVEERLSRLPQDEPPEEYREPLPYIVIIVDEFADLMLSSGKEIEQAIARLAQKARAAGIHVILATQRPSADVVTGLIKSNLPCRICFQVKSKIDSRIVLDGSGAEKLAGKGDMLYMPPGSSQLIRAKGVFVADHEIRALVDFCKSQAAPVYSDEIERVAAQAAAAAAGGTEGSGPDAMELDESFEDAVECFLAMGRASTSLLQRRMGLGYTRAAKICDQMESRGIVGPDRGAKGRELLITLEGWDAYKKGKLAGRAVPTVAPANDGTGPGLNEALTCLDDIDGVRDAAPAGTGTLTSRRNDFPPLDENEADEDSDKDAKDAKEADRKAG